MYVSTIDKNILLKVLHNSHTLWFLIIDEHEIMISFGAVLVHFHPVIFFEVHGILFKDDFEFFFIGNFKYNET